ncbi:SAP domain [Macleaya cordata]|uniref:SAP domain n=1 Tax=Macleaya cordata TaxID=56857 RepID=A0A200PYK4_MACCD|nr:SAP domain [Macleaya cordata]
MPTQYPVLNGRPIDQWKVAELKEELKRRKLPIRGLKDDLIKRLDEAILSERASAKEVEEAICNESDSAQGKVGKGFDCDPEPQVYAIGETQPTNTPIVEDAKENSDNKTGKLDGDEAVVHREEEAIHNEGDSTKEKVVNGFDCNPKPQVSEVGDTQPINTPIVEDASENSKNKTRKSDDVEAMTDKEEEAIHNERDYAKEEVGNGFDCNPEPQVSEVGETQPINTPIVEDAREKSKDKTRKLDDDKAMVDIDAIDDSSVELGQGKVQDAGSMDGTDSTATVMEPVVLSVSVETNITVTQSVVTQMASKGQELQNSEADMENEVPNPPSGDSMLNLSNQNSQVSEVSPDIGFHVKSESISTDSVSINEKNELKDNLNADNFHIELDVVKPEMVQPSSSEVPPDGGATHPLDGQEPCENQGSMEGIDDTNATNVDLSKKSDATDGGSLEKLNLDRSSGDDSMEEDVLESKHIDSNHNSDEMGEKNNLTEVHDVKGESPFDATLSGVSDKDTSAENRISLAFFFMLLTFSTSQRSISSIDQEVVRNNEPPKRQRRWNSESLKVPEPQTSNLTPSTTPKDAFQSTISKRNFTRSDSTLSSGNAQERVVPPSSKTPTTSLRIDHFLRPFTLKAVQELLAKTGAVCSFWMDHIKTHCYVMYSSVEEAIETRNALYNLQWPPNGGKLLVAEFVEPQEVKMRAEATPPAAAPVSTTPKTAPPSAPSSKPPQASPRQQVSRQQLPPPPPLPPAPPITSDHPPPTRERLTLPPPPPLPKNVDPPIVTLDDLFRKTRATPRIYYLPLSEEQVAAKLAAQGKNTK